MHPSTLRPENLRKSAVLNSLTGIVDFAAKLGVSFFLNPLMISLLGPIYFGAWQVISQLNSYMATADIRAATSLKFILSRDRSVSSELELKKVVSSALYSNLFFIPVYLCLGVFVIWFSPILSGVDYEFYLTVRIASAFLVLSFVVTQFFFLFESTLHGMNLSYKRIGVRAAIIILAGISSAVILYMDYGIIGLAIVQVFAAVLIGFSFWIIVKKYIPWFEFVRVSRNRIFSFIKLSGWYMFLKIADLLSQSIDMILLGYLAGPEYVAVYAITKYLMIASSGLVRTVSTATTVGIAKFIGENSYDKLLEAREQLLNVQWFLIIITGNIVCLYNQSFIQLWTKESLFSGQIESLLIIIISIFTMMYQVDSGIINSTLKLKRKIIVTFISSIISIVLSFILVPQFKTLGLLIAISIGIIFLALSLTYLVKVETGADFKIFKVFYSRLALVGYLFLTISFYSTKWIFINNWLQLVVLVIFTALLLGVLTWYLGFDSSERKILRRSIKMLNKK
ncbi:oligosaccharide flippase family protein [Nonlabens sp. SY33080]|uniref:oligosaccharide flippase family protein n=1 Tax=Nonlabens sp. SY33080 TaxID=2719911 RepID=UPI001428C4DC|nr:oligosaccharide flippase family protein [Nonlabens sp. SY33080]